MSFARPARPRLLLLIVCAGALALLGAYLLAFAGGGDSGGERRIAKGTCAPGFIRADKEEAGGRVHEAAREAARERAKEERGEEEEREREAGMSEKEREAEHARERFIEKAFESERWSNKCINISHPEQPEDIARFGEAASLRFGGERPGAVRTALRQKAHLADDPSVDGANGTWQPLGKGPLIADDPKYPFTYGDAYGALAGRLSDYAYDAGTNRLFVTVAQGGVWQSNDRGENWFSISDGPDGLPMQSVGGIAWTPAGGDGGTLVVATGDHAFSNDYSGLGVYYTTDEGRHWTHAKGVPDGGLSYQIVVDPTNNRRLYAATGLGLFRSDDAGRNWQNVNLPTGECAGDSFKANCFFANIVTSVQVQPADKFDHKGGKVAAAVGWRAGQLPNFAGKPQSPANGIYISDTGDPGSFTKVGDDKGITVTAEFGRAELAAVQTPEQNAEHLYAIVQNAKYFTSGTDVENDVPDCDPVIGLACPNSGSVLDGIYVSADFGKTWTVMEDHDTFVNDATNGSSINQLRPVGIAAGYQVTYNEWIKVDPTQQDGSGTPTHLVFGMEELWQNQVPGQPMNGKTRFESFGPYNQAGACLLVLLAETCGTTQTAQPLKYTTHPDQHGGILLPGAEGGTELLAGNDGGNYRKASGPGGQFDRNWGRGNQNGFHTLLPYGVAMAKDRVVYAGLQDNGQMRIDPKTGVQNMVYGGDGVFTVVNPDNSDEVIEEYPTARLSASKDGGVSWFDLAPNVEEPDFVSPLVQDDLDHKHISTSGRQIVESTKWVDTTYNGCQRQPGQDTHPDDPINGCSPSDTDWVPVFDLGTQKHPGDQKAGRETEGDETSASKSTPEDPVNHAVAQDIHGAAHYVGYCGSCDPVKLHHIFENGIATNVGGAKPAKVASPDGWHIAKAEGLPNRFITGVEIDPKDVNTVYVTLGTSASRPFAPLGSLGEDASSSKGGYVYVSHDHGETFSDVSGDLPKVQASWIRLRGDQMVVANAVGMFISQDLTGKHWAPLGSGFPNSPVYSFEFEPGDANKIVVASFGRGIWEYDFTKRTGPAVLGAEIAGGKRPACSDTTGPTSRFLTNIKKAAKRSGRGLVLRGTSKYKKCKGGPNGKVKRVVVTLKLQKGKRCRYLTKKGRLTGFRSCKKRATFFTAKGKGKWSFKVKGPLPAGKYVAYARAKDDLGNTERRTAHRNFRHFRLRGKAVLAGWHGKQKNTVG
jgi:hypothetical protein